MSSRRASILMLIAVLPMITYLGHWDTGAVMDAVTPAMFETHDHGSHDHGSESDHEESHAQHCHGRLISCADVPFAGSATVAFLGAAMLAVAASLSAWRQPVATLERLRPFEPELLAPPPRGRRSTPSV